MMTDRFSTEEFESSFTYHGNDLGAQWTKEKTTFRLWAPTADEARVCLYRSGDPNAPDLMERIVLKKDESGTWLGEKAGDLHGVYYTYQVRIGDYTGQGCDPYARTTGVNGQRAMVLDLASTDPPGWETDCNPNASLSITDSIIYELHIRDLSMDPSSGIRHKGKFLGLTESGTHTAAGIPTGLDHIKSLGITHLHLLPIFDFGSVDEAQPECSQFNWGYDPMNFNVPEGSYATDPFHGEVRVRELKQMVKALHDNGISVVMDVVYNHVYDSANFCFNTLVPGYFSRSTDGVLSNGSFCGNDTASERSMVRKYIIDSVCYWADEYHIDGFRFDLLGLLDICTINAIVSAVHRRHPNVIFYGEGWSLPTHPTKPCDLATQTNSHLTPELAFFNDTLRDALMGPMQNRSAPGFAAGAIGGGDILNACFRGLPCWCSNPCQSVNYVSCHDNNTLLDRITLSTPGRSFADRIRMNRLAAAFVMTAQGIPFLQAGEEMLRSKPSPRGGFVENSYNAPDSVNSLKWSLLRKKEYREQVDYYRGLIAFRKAHPALRMRSAYEVLSNLVPNHCEDFHVGGFLLRGEEDPASELLVLFSNADSPREITLPRGRWNLYIDGDRAGTQVLDTLEGTVEIPPICAMVLGRA